MWHDTVMPKRPRDPNQLAKLVVDIATGEIEDTVSDAKRNPVQAPGWRTEGRSGSR